MKVAFQGERGAYSEEAVTQVFGEAEALPRPTLRDVFDTVTAERHLRGAAAIASVGAAHIYGLAVLAEGIETNPANYTKFLSLAPEPAPRIVGAKTSIVFTTQNIPGALYLALGAFATRSINLTKLESRPRREVPWEYLFYVDFEGHQDDPPAAAALLDLSRVTVFLRILGSYPKSPPPLP